MKVIAYIRTSTKDQLAAFGPERQREAITAWAAAGSHRIIAEVIEDVSGTLAPFGAPAGRTSSTGAVPVRPAVSWSPT